MTLSLSFVHLRFFTSLFSDKVLPNTSKLSEWEYEKFWERAGICNQSSQFKLKSSLAESFYDVKYWNVNYYVKCLSEKCWFLVHCFFSVIWNISQMNVFKTKCELKCQNDFWNLEITVFIFYVFITEIFMANIWRDNWRFNIWPLKGLCYCDK